MKVNILNILLSLCLAKCILEGAHASPCLSENEINCFQHQKLEISELICKKDALIKWKHYDTSTNISKIHVQYKTNVDMTWHKEEFISQLQSSYTVGLSPGLNYTFQVLAMETSGAEINTPEKSCLSDPDVPFRNPSNFSLELKNKTESVLVSWEPLKVEEYNGPDFLYQVKWQPITENKTTWKTINVTNCELSSICTRDVPIGRNYSEYVFKVNSRNKVGLSNSTAIEKRIYTKKLQLNDVTCKTKTARITWKYYHDDVESFPSFEVQYKISNGVWVNSGAITNKTYYTMPINPGLTYTFRVAAVINNTITDISDESNICKTPADVPYRNPKNVTIKFNSYDENKTEMLIFWEALPDFDHNGPDFKYLAQWKPNDPNITDWYNEIMTDCNTTCRIATEINPKYSNYIVNISTMNKIGKSKSPPSVKTGMIFDKVYTENANEVAFHGFLNFKIITISVISVILLAAVCLIIYCKKTKKYKPLNITEENTGEKSASPESLSLVSEDYAFQSRIGTPV